MSTVLNQQCSDINNLLSKYTAKINNNNNANMLSKSSMKLAGSKSCLAVNTAFFLVCIYQLQLVYLHPFV